MKLLKYPLAAALLGAAFGTQAAPDAIRDAGIPHLERQGTAAQLIVDGKPFLIRGGELGNSSASNLDALKSLWPRLVDMKLNTVVLPVEWDLLEPSEGRFDFALVDGMLQQAREHHMHLVLLWFGAWKNSMSTYVPAWVKQDGRRFPRAEDLQHRKQDILSPLGENTVQADSKAFAALLRHLREVDQDHTVLIVQVENEIGMLPEAREHSPLADAAYEQSVPAELMKRLKSSREQGSLAPEMAELWKRAGGKTQGNWAEVFGTGPSGEEVFQAWCFARYVDRVTAAGKAEYPLPMYVNAALIRAGHQPGQYPSAGPLPHLADIWHAGAPKLDFLSPDIYFPNFVEWAAKYTRNGNPLFIPEALRSVDAAVNGLYAYAQLEAIGFSPFGIETITEPAQSLMRDSFDIVSQLTPLLLAKRGQGMTAGFLPAGPEQRAPQRVEMGGYVMNVSFERAKLSSLADGVINESGAAAGAASYPAGGLVIQLGPDEFLFAGIGITSTFSSLKPGESVGLTSVQQGRYVNGKWQSGRWLNGDQTHQGRHVRLDPGAFDMQLVKLYKY